jgi:outer membrane murein-binding lipoprotein Lpp
MYICTSIVTSLFILHSPFPIPEVTAKSNTLSSELKEEKSSLKKLKADYQQLQDDHSETKAEKEAAERVRILSLSLSHSLIHFLPPLVPL